MIREPDRHRIGKARLLRRQGKTYNEIRDVIGAVDDQTLLKWLRGISRPNETRRSRSMPELAKECRRMRSQGLSNSEIVAKTGASVGSVSLWLRGVKIPSHLEAARQQDFRERQLRGSRAMHEKWEARRLAEVATAAREVNHLTDRELLLVGAALYWAEGAKSKPWRRDRRVTFTNQDVGILRVFLAWLDLIGVPVSARRFRLSIHETADVVASEAWWSEQLDLGPTSFQRATLKHHNPRTIRHFTGDDYHGCLVVSVTKSSALYDRIDGWWNAVVAALSQAPAN